MPTYEYFCNNCKRRFDLRFSYEDYGITDILCIYCSSINVRRRITRFRLKRSELSRLADMPDPASLEGLDEDPQSLGKMIRRISRESGEDLGPEFDEVVDRLESGQSASEIEKGMPDIGDESGPDDVSPD